jgi:hypothetical protein
VVSHRPNVLVDAAKLTQQSWRAPEPAAILVAESVEDSRRIVQFAELSIGAEMASLEGMRVGHGEGL